MKMRPIIIDFETRSGTDLATRGIGNYLADPEYNLLCAVTLLPDGEWLTVMPDRFISTPTDARERLFAAVRAGHPVTAHNAEGFDRLVWQKAGWPAPSVWIDSLHLARRLGLPGGLDRLGAKLYGAGKDNEGRKSTLALSKHDKHGRLPPLTQRVLDRVADYCRRDVEILARVWADRLAAVVNAPTTFEDWVAAASDDINDRGVPFDGDLARAVIACAERVAGEARGRVPEKQRRIITSPKAIKRFLRDEGIDVPDVTSATVDSLLDDPNLPETVRVVLLARVAAAPNTARRLKTGLMRREADGHLRHTFTYFGAHTGRWSGRGFQPQNLPRGVPIDIEDAIAAAMRGDLAMLEAMSASEKVQKAKPGATVDDVLATLVRPCLVAAPGHVLAVADYSSIEARALLWLAGDERGLNVYREGCDPYVEMAAKVYGIPAGEISDDQRKLGKVLILGCGYGLGAKGFGTYSEAMGVDLAAAGVTAEAAVDAWRDANPYVAGFPNGLFNGRPARVNGLWKDVEAAATAAVSCGGVRYAGRCRFEKRRADLICTLPNGREMVYPDARIVDRPTPWGSYKGVLEHGLRGGRVATYGGRLVENITQATCRDLLADAMVHCELLGLRVVLHVHDELVCEVEDGRADADYETMVGIMQS
ncbi:MAG TPA: DNA polymerase, partial [Phycisphaerae bacterium]|nr:DNA polymerase [Phycisphaerae bacterium]